MEIELQILDPADLLIYLMIRDSSFLAFGYFLKSANYKYFELQRALGPHNFFQNLIFFQQTGQWSYCKLKKK